MSRSRMLYSSSPLNRIIQLPNASVPAERSHSSLVASRWRPGLPAPLHNEILASGNDGSGAGFALALARDALSCSKAAGGRDQDTRSVLWVQDTAALRLGGRVCRAGLSSDLRDRLIHVEARTPEDALFALEEGLKCHDLAFVLGELAGNPRALDFTVSRRLSLTAEKHGIHLWLVRLDADADLSSARMRWRVCAGPSQRPYWDSSAPDAPAWQAELFRARSHPSGKWSLRDDEGRLVAARPAVLPQPANSDPGPSDGGAAHNGDLARPTVGRSLAAM